MPLYDNYKNICRYAYISRTVDELWYIKKFKEAWLTKKVREKAEEI